MQSTNISDVGLQSKAVLKLGRFLQIPTKLKTNIETLFFSVIQSLEAAGDRKHEGTAINLT